MTDDIDYDAAERILNDDSCKHMVISEGDDGHLACKQCGVRLVGGSDGYLVPEREAGA